MSSLPVWHPRCLAVAETAIGEPVPVPGLEGFEMYPMCNYIDKTVTVIAAPEEDEGAFRVEWTCPRCGSTDFDWMPTSFERLMRPGPPDLV